MHPRLEFLYLGAMIAVAASLEGNILATWLAFAAFALTFIVIRVERKKTHRRPVSSAPSLREGRKNRENNPPAVSNHGDDPMHSDIGNRRTKEIALKLHNMVQEAVQEGAHMAASANDDSPLDAAYICCNTTLASMVPAALIFADKSAMDELSKLPPDEMEKKGKEFLYRLVTPDLMLFAALVCVNMQDSIDPATGAVEITFGPEIFYYAMKEWEKVTGKKPETLNLSPGLLKAIKRVEANTGVPFDQFLQKRSQSLPPSGTTH